LKFIAQSDITEINKRSQDIAEDVKTFMDDRSGNTIWKRGTWQACLHGRV